MINNNRQNNNNRRNRNRNNQQRQGGGGGGGNRPEQGNRIDSRARGNAPQLLEKYKNLARDAQMQGDRVMTEYYLQFADHYFRVIADNRARYEEQQAQRRQQYEPQGEIEGVAMGVEGEPIPLSGGQDDRGNRADRDDDGDQPGGNRDSDDIGNVFMRRDDSGRDLQRGRNPRRDTPRAHDAGNGADYGSDASDDEGERAPLRRQRVARNDRDARNERDGRDTRNDREDRHDRDDDAIGQLDLAALPPAIGEAGAAPAGSDNDGDAPAPRRRGRPRRVTTEAAASDA